jgi:antitoxin component YwqK of YwqJK toxin-antitoxin module
MLIYYTTGTLFRRSRYWNGKLHGQYEQYGMTGIPVLSLTYKHGKANGLLQKWDDETGRLMEISHHKNGKLHGVCRKWSHNRIGYVQINYVNGLKHGLYEEYKPYGPVRLIAEYHHGSIVKN